MDEQIKDSAERVVHQNSDLLKLENSCVSRNDFVEKLLITDNARQTSLKTEKISSSVLDRAKTFLASAKQEVSDRDNDKDADIVEDFGEEEEKLVEMNLIIFEDNDDKNLTDL